MAKAAAKRPKMEQEAVEAAASLYVRQQMQKHGPPRDDWHLDKRIPIAIIAAILMQSSAAIWWASAVSARMEVLEAGYKFLQPQGDRLTRVEEKIGNLNEKVVDVARDVKQLLTHSESSSTVRK